MSTSALGRRQVRRSGFGAMQLAGQYAAGPLPDRASAVAVLQAAVAAGVDHIDTAEYYGGVNDLIRAALHPYPDGLAIVSKVAARRANSGTVLPFNDAGQLRADIVEYLVHYRRGTDSATQPPIETQAHHLPKPFAVTAK